MNRTRTLAVCVLALTAVLSVAACSKAKTGTGGSSNTSSAASGGATGQALSAAQLAALKSLTEARLCGLLTPAEAASTLGKPTAAPTFTNTLGMGLVCEWKADGSDKDELYIGVSTILDWKAAQAITKLLGATSFTIAGHPAAGAEPNPSKSIDYAFVDVAMGGDKDPAVEFRAPSLAVAKALATLATPRIIALV